MGTHGLKGLQKFTGSWALKVITGSKAPFVVVQDKPLNSDIHKVVLPLDFKLEERQKLVWVQFVAKAYKCKFYLCYIENSANPQAHSGKYLRSHQIFGNQSNQLRTSEARRQGRTCKRDHQLRSIYRLGAYYYYDYQKHPFPGLCAWRSRAADYRQRGKDSRHVCQSDGMTFFFVIVIKNCYLCPCNNCNTDYNGKKI